MVGGEFAADPPEQAGLAIPPWCGEADYPPVHPVSNQFSDFRVSPEQLTWLDRRVKSERAEFHDSSML